MICFEGENANIIWDYLIKSSNVSPIVNSRAGDTLEMLHTIISLTNPKQKWIDLKYPPISIAFALADLMWVLNGSNCSEIINYWNPSLPKYAGNSECYHGAYGYRIFKGFKFNQLESAYNTLYYNSNSRQVVITIWDPIQDTPFPDGTPRDNDIPCNICSLIKVRSNHLEWTQIMRSNDLIKGFPYDISLFSSLQEILASWLSLELGTYTHYSDSMHIYTSSSKSFLSSNSHSINSDSLSIKKSDSLYVFNLIFDIMKEISKGQINEERLLMYSKLNTGYEAYNNILIILCAYSSYKEQYLITEQIINKCTNNVYKTMWKNWASYREKVNNNVKK